MRISLEALPYLLQEIPVRKEQPTPLLDSAKILNPYSPGLITYDQIMADSIKALQNGEHVAFINTGLGMAGKTTLGGEELTKWEKELLRIFGGNPHDHMAYFAHEHSQQFSFFQRGWGNRAYDTLTFADREILNRDVFENMVDMVKRYKVSVVEAPGAGKRGDPALAELARLKGIKFVLFGIDSKRDTTKSMITREYITEHPGQWPQALEPNASVIHIDPTAPETQFLLTGGNVPGVIQMNEHILDQYIGIGSQMTDASEEEVRAALTIDVYPNSTHDAKRDVITRHFENLGFKPGEIFILETKHVDQVHVYADRLGSGEKGYNDILKKHPILIPVLLKNAGVISFDTVEPEPSSKEE